MEGVGLGGVGQEKGAEGVFLGGVLRGGEQTHELGFDAGIAAAVPVSGDEGFDEEILQGADGVEGLAVVEGEGLEFGGVFAGDDEGAGVNAGFEGIEAGNGLARVGAGAGGAERVEAVSFDLRDSCHGDCRIARGAGGV